MTIKPPTAITYQLPSKDHLTSTEAFSKARDALVRAERDLSFVATAKPTDLEEKASRIVEKIKTWEETNVHMILNDGSGFEAAHKYLHGIDTIQKSAVLEIAKKAPKGALLHCHLEAMLRPHESLLIDARNQKNLYIETDAPLVSKGFFDHALPRFQLLAEDSEPTIGTNTFSKSYIPGSLMKYSLFLEQFPGGMQRAEDWIASKIVLHAKDAYHAEQTVDGIWSHFMRTFVVLRGLFNYETAYKNHFRRVIWSLARDGIMYVELRISMHYGNYARRDDGTADLNHKEMVQLLSDVLSEDLPRVKAKGLHFSGARFIFTAFRSCTKDEMLWCIDDCIALKQAFPDLICGFDMAGPENAGHPLSFFIPELLLFRQKCEDLSLHIPFIFHAGETLDHGGEVDSNLYDAILLGTKRIGHGYSLTKHPLLMQLCKENKIAVEICPISNEVLGLCPTIKNHPLPILLSNCVPCSINSDDPGVWEATLSHDFYQVLMGSNSMSLVGWRVLVQWSIEYSCMGMEEKERAEVAFLSQWHQFCQHIVDSYDSRF
ncbi:Metallo-dependent hydrolase [Aureobasidium pullulans]|nr:Metallo-dependent hydrolase [Aureobasidium pullulans]